MGIIRMDHVTVVVDDLEAAIAFFEELGMELVGRQPVEGDWVDRLAGLESTRADIAMMRTPDGHGQIELTKYHVPAGGEPPDAPGTSPLTAVGLRQIMFAVDDIDDTVARLRASGAELVGDVVQYEDAYRLCYVRGPASMIVALAQPLG
jgi:catechol 2,3-dioxygenase-like lactoylglutathione lyase family enzyme